MNAARTVAIASSVTPKTKPRSRTQTTSCTRPAAPEKRNAAPSADATHRGWVRSRRSLRRSASCARRRSLRLESAVFGIRVLIGGRPGVGREVGEEIEEVPVHHGRLLLLHPVSAEREVLDLQRGG